MSSYMLNARDKLTLNRAFTANQLMQLPKSMNHLTQPTPAPTTAQSHFI